MSTTTSDVLIDKELKITANDLQEHPLFPLIAYKLSPSRPYLRTSPTKFATLKETETYCRSEMHPLSKNSSIHFLYADSNNTLKNGKQAHVGNYCNIMQALGDEFEPKPTDEKLPTTPGQSTLYHDILGYKNNICQYITNEFAQNNDNAFIKVGFYNDYPCVMVHIDRKSIFKAPETKQPSDAAFEEWINFLISCYVGLVNYYAIHDNTFIELERRSSFGFITPSISPTGESFRINVGLIPKVYANLLVKGLKALNTFLKKIQDVKAPISKTIFYYTDKYKKYNKKYQPVELESLVQLLFAQVDTKGKTTVQNILRTAYARDGIASKVFEALDAGNSTENAFVNGLTWAIQNLQITKQNTTKAKLNFKQTEEISYTRKFKNSKYIVEDPEFWKIVNKIISAATDLKSKILLKVIKKLNKLHIENVITNLHYHLELLNELMFIMAIQTSDPEGADDGYGSDSDTEEEVAKVKLYGKKLITHNGMRAIWSAIIAATKNIAKPRIFLQSAYYEVPLGLPIIAKLHKLNFTLVKKASDANILLYDLNACVTRGYVTDIVLPLCDDKVLILDVTSSTAKNANLYIEQFSKSRAALIFLVDSGFKNQQLGADKNQYGTVRIFARNKKVRDTYYKLIKEIERPLLSPTSHRSRRIYKRIGLVPRTLEFLNPNIINSKKPIIKLNYKNPNAKKCPQ